MKGKLWDRKIFAGRPQKGQYQVLTMSCFRVSKLLKVLLFSIIFKNTKLLYNQKFCTYKIGKMIDCEYIFDQEIFVQQRKFSTIFSHVFSISNTYFLTRIFSSIEIKKYVCTRSKKLFSIESFPEWKTALKFPYDANTLINITLKYIFHILLQQMSCWKQT